MLGKDKEAKTPDTIIIILILLASRVYLTINLSTWNTSGSQQQASTTTDFHSELLNSELTHSSFELGYLTSGNTEY